MLIHEISFVGIRSQKNLIGIKIVRDYLTTIDESLDRKVKTMNDVYHTLRSESGVCHSQCCSFERHGSDMGFMVHTLCTDTSCANFSTCINNMEALESIVRDNLIVKEDPVIGQYEKGLFSGNSGFDLYTVEVNLYDARIYKYDGGHNTAGAVTVFLGLESSNQLIVIIVV